MLIFNRHLFSACCLAGRVLCALEAVSHPQEFTDQMQKVQLKKQDHRATVSQGMVGSREVSGRDMEALEAEREAAF
jgi:hypothetical protein